jgi:hypothetical protein
MSADFGANSFPSYFYSRDRTAHKDCKIQGEGCLLVEIKRSEASHSPNKTPERWAV